MRASRRDVAIVATIAMTWALLIALQIWVCL